MSKEAMTLALEEFKHIKQWCLRSIGIGLVNENVLAALEEALKQEQDDPVELRETLSRFLADKGIYLSKESIDEFMQKIGTRPVAWIEHEWTGTGLRKLHFDRHEPTVRDEVVNPIWTPLYTKPQPSQKPLTPEQFNHMPELFVIPPHHVEMVVRAIEAAHNIKE